MLETVKTCILYLILYSGISVSIAISAGIICLPFLLIGLILKSTCDGVYFVTGLLYKSFDLCYNRISLNANKNKRSDSSEFKQNI